MCDANATAASRGRLLSWIEIDETAVESNVRTFRRRLRPETSLQAVVKSNAYGHGLDVIARAAGRAGVDSFGVHSAGEAEALAAIDPSRPMLILGYIGIHEADRVVRAGAEATVYNAETLEALSAAASRSSRDVRCHIKVETGVNRQGIAAQDLDGFIDRLQSLPGLVLAGVSTHFANIEDTTDHTFARRQLELFRLAAARVRERSPLAVRHCACTAAALTMPETFFDMVRVGIGIYGIWPSKETLLSCLIEGKEGMPLVPVMTWKTRIAQIKTVSTGESVGYGCEHKVTHPTRVAVLPIGYADGYDRRLSGVGHVLVAGRRAPVLGRVCMNLVMIDVTDIETARLEDEVVLLGQQGEGEITATQVAAQCHTIAYEIVSRIAPCVPRLAVTSEDP